MVISVQPKYFAAALGEPGDDAAHGSRQIGGLELLLDARRFTEPLPESHAPTTVAQRIQGSVANGAIEIGRDRSRYLPHAPSLPQRHEQLLHDFLRDIARADIPV